MPRPGRIYVQHKTQRSGDGYRYMVVEIRTAPGVLERTSYSLRKHTRAEAVALAAAWLAPRIAKQTETFEALRKKWEAER